MKATLEFVFKNFNGVIFIIDENGIFVLSEGLSLEKIGLLPGEVVGKSVFSIYSKFPDIIECVKTAMNGKSIRKDIYINDICFDVVFSPYSLASGSANGVIGIATDITNLKITQRRLDDTEEKFKIIIDLAPECFLQGDEDGNIIYANEKVKDITGYSPEEIMGKKISFIFTHETLKQTPLRYDLLKKGEAVISEREIKKKNGDIVTIQSNSKQMPDGTFVTFIRDISKLRKEQRVGENNARLESLGVLAAGIAHNFNNLMTGIFNYTSIASYHSKELYTKEMLNKVQLLIDKVRSLTARLITFSAGGYIEKSYCNVENIVNEIIKNIENPKYTVENIVNTSSISEIDEAQFRLAVEGILNNAVQSMPDGGKLTVSSQKIKLDDSNSYSLKGGEYIKLSVKDEGIGISSESLSKIYDPFYSTKDGHDGIGLSIAYSVIKKLDGTINCKSTPGVGTVFDILLPVVN